MVTGEFFLPRKDPLPVAEGFERLAAAFFAQYHPNMYYDICAHQSGVLSAAALSCHPPNDLAATAQNLNFLADYLNCEHTTAFATSFLSALNALHNDVLPGCIRPYANSKNVECNKVVLSFVCACLRNGLDNHLALDSAKLAQKVHEISDLGSYARQSLNDFCSDGAQRRMVKDLLNIIIEGLVVSVKTRFEAIYAAGSFVPANSSALKNEFMLLAQFVDQQHANTREKDGVTQYEQRSSFVASMLPDKEFLTHYGQPTHQSLFEWTKLLWPTAADSVD